MQQPSFAAARGSFLADSTVSWQGATKKAERFSAQFYTLNWLERQGAGWTGEGSCVALWQPRPGAPKIATLLLDDLAFFTNVRCKADVKLDSSMKVEMSRCLPVGARARQQGRQKGRGVGGRGISTTKLKAGVAFAVFVCRVRGVCVLTCFWYFCVVRVRLVDMKAGEKQRETRYERRERLDTNFHRPVRQT